MSKKDKSKEIPRPYTGSDFEYLLKSKDEVKLKGSQKTSLDKYFDRLLKTGSF